MLVCALYVRSRAHSGSHDQTSHYNLIGWSHMTAESAQPRKRHQTLPFRGRGLGTRLSCSACCTHGCIPEKTGHIFRKTAQFGEQEAVSGLIIGLLQSPKPCLKACLCLHVWYLTISVWTTIDCRIRLIPCYKSIRLS